MSASKKLCVAPRVPSPEPLPSPGEFKINKIFPVDVEGRRPETWDFYGVCQLLRQNTLLELAVSPDAFSDYLIANNKVGTVIKQAAESGEEDNESADGEMVFGVVSMLNISETVRCCPPSEPGATLHHRRNDPCVAALRTALLHKCRQHGSEDTLAKLTEVFDNDPTRDPIGLFINERFLGIPKEVSLFAIKSLRREIDANLARERPYNFSHVVVITKIVRFRADKGDITWVNEEVASLLPVSLLHFDYPTNLHEGNDNDDVDEEERRVWGRMVMVVTMEVFNNFMANVI